MPPTRTGYRYFLLSAPYRNQLRAPFRSTPWRNGWNVADCLLGRVHTSRADCWCGIIVMPDLHRTVLELHWHLDTSALVAKIEHGVDVDFINAMAVARVRALDDWVPDVHDHPDVWRTEAAKLAELWTLSPVVSPLLRRAYSDVDIHIGTNLQQLAPAADPSTHGCYGCGAPTYPICSAHRPTAPRHGP